MMNEKKPTWSCPVCDQRAPYDSLAICALFTDILQTCRDTCDEIVFAADATWTKNIPGGGGGGATSAKSKSSATTTTSSSTSAAAKSSNNSVEEECVDILGTICGSQQQLLHNDLVFYFRILCLDKMTRRRLKPIRRRSRK